MAITEEEWITSYEGAELMGIPQPNFLYYAGNGKPIAVKPDTKKGERLYNRADVIALRKKLAKKKRKNAPPEKPLIDWFYASDLPAGLKLVQQLYGPDVDLADLAVYQGWWKHNNRITMTAFSQDRQECYASIQILPLDENVILNILRGKRSENSVHPDEIRSYDEPGPYDLLATSATVLPNHPLLLFELLHRYMEFWVEQYPERYMRRVYAQAMSARGVQLIQHFFMSPRRDLAYNAYELDMAVPSASKVIQRFKKKLVEKAPLPPDLQWPPVQPSTTD